MRRWEKWLINYLDNRILNSPIGEEKKACTDAITWLEKLCKQKSADKTESRFKSGDWVVYDGWICQIIDVTVDGYCNSQHGFIPKNREDSMRLWTIQDAKDGDVLAGHETIVLFKKIEGQNIRCYCTYLFTNNPHLYVDTLQSKNHYCPATKEQRDTLMKAMADAGYTFDFEKKELKKIPNAFEECEIVHVEHGKYYYCIKDYYAGGNKRASKGDVVQALNGMNMMALGAKANEYFIPVNAIKQMSTWSEEDENRVNRLIAYFEDKESFTAEDDIVYANWLKSLKDKVLSQPKQEWSGEDKKMLENVKKTLYNLTLVEADGQAAFKKELAWLKFLKQRYTWKPSDEQIKVCKEVYADILSAKGFDLGTVNRELNRMEEQLKKLKG